MRYSLAGILAVAAFLPTVLYGGKLSLSVFYTPMTVSREEVMPENPLADNYHRITVTTPERANEPETYYLIIEGIDSSEQSTETVILKGFSSNRIYFLAKVNGELTFENKEKIPRRFSVVEEGESSPKDFVVPPLGTARYSFLRAGNCTFIDNDNPSLKIFVRVLVGCALYPLRGSSLRVDIPSLNPGTYSIKIFYAFRQLFQEDFAMVSDSALDMIYRISNREVFRDDSTTITSNRIVSGFPKSRQPRAATTPEGSTPRSQP